MSKNAQWDGYFADADSGYFRLSLNKLTFTLKYHWDEGSDRDQYDLCLMDREGDQTPFARITAEDFQEARKLAASKIALFLLEELEQAVKAND